MRGGSQSVNVVFGAVLAAAVTLFIGGCPTNDVRDSHCEPDSEDSRCLYVGDGRGPQTGEGRCQLPGPGDGSLVPGSADCPDFGAVRRWMDDAERGNCTASGCHGGQGTAAIGIYFPTENNAACEVYRALVGARGSVGLAYVTPDDPETPDNEALGSWMYCNVIGAPGGGFAMPKPGGVHPVERADVIRDWLRCGAPGPDNCALGSGT